MYQSLALFQTAHAMAKHAGARQAVTARNVANADTPDFRAQTVAPFADVYKTDTMPLMRMTRAGHMSTASMVPTAEIADSTGQPSPNGNTVSIEEEMMNAINISREHNRALAIYRHGMTVLRSSLGR